MKTKLLFVFFIASFNVYTQVCFYPHTEYLVGTNTNTKAITSGDFNNDGIPDLAVAIVTPSMVSILLGNGAGAFNLASSYTIANTQPYAIVSTDFNNDGKADVAVANNGSALQGVTILLGNGVGALSAAYSYTTTGVNPAAIAYGDFNADGKKDIAITNFNSSPGTVTVRFGNGNGTMGAASTYTVGTQPGGIVCADVTGDGKLDLVTANVGSNNVTVLFNTGSGAFSVAGTFTTGTGTGPRDLVAVDLNADAKLDLITCNTASNNVSVLLNNNSGQYGGPTTYLAGTGAWGIATADFDGDSKADVAVANMNSNNVSILRGDGAGGLYTPPINFLTATKPVKLVSADFNGDGKKDVATANEDVSTNNTSILLNSLPGPVTISGTATICTGTNNTLTAIGSSSYVWSSSGQTTTSIIVNPTSNTTYSVTGTNTGCAVTATGTKTINVNPLPAVTANATATAMCAGTGTSVTLTGGGAISYIWSGSVINGVGFIPISTTTYTVIGTDGNNCSNTATKTITVNPLPTVTANASPASTVCAGTTVTLSGGGANSYVWSGGVTNGVGFVPTTTTTYSVTGTDGNNCSKTATKNITVNPLPIVTANATALTLCAGTSVTLTGGGATSYVWSGGVINGVGFVPTSTTTYLVAGTDGNSCSNTAAATVYILTPPIPSICAVTVDSLSKYNLIIWDKTPFTSVDTFLIYRDTANNNYAPIGKVPFDSLSQFIDTIRTLYSANGDPNVSSWRYKLATIDTCGNKSAMSPYHQTMFIQNNSGNFSWNHYQIEGQVQPIPALSNYLFERDDFSLGPYVIIQTLSASSTAYTDPQYATYQNTASWRAITAWSIVCTSTFLKNPLLMAATYTVSKSNSYKTTLPIALNELSLENSVTIFPNPSNGEFQIQVSGGNSSGSSFSKSCEGQNDCKIEIYNVFGEKIYFEKMLNSKPITINLVLPNGFYFAHIKTERGETVKKIIIAH